MSKIVGKALPDMPWQDKDENDKLPVWRYKANPIIDRFATRNSNSIFNSAVVPFEDGYAGIFRCDSRSISMDIFAGFSKDGSIGIFRMIRSYSTVMMKRLEKEITDMIREYVL